MVVASEVVGAEVDVVEEMVVADGAIGATETASVVDGADVAGAPEQEAAVTANNSMPGNRDCRRSTWPFPLETLFMRRVFMLRLGSAVPGGPGRPGQRRKMAGSPAAVFPQPDNAGRPGVAERIPIDPRAVGILRFSGALGSPR